MTRTDVAVALVNGIATAVETISASMPIAPRAAAIVAVTILREAVKTPAAASKE